MGDASYQLWFLPALLLYQLVTLVVVRNLPSLRSRTHLLILALLFLSMLLPLLRLSGHGDGHFYANLINNLQFVFLVMYVLFLLRDSILNGRLIKWGGQFFLSRAGVDILGAVPSVLFVLSVFTLSLFISELLGRVKLVRSWHVLG